MFAHLFDHDNLYINKLEAIIDRFSEICDIKSPEDKIVRDRLINIISLDMLIKLVKKLPASEQGILKSLKDSPNIDDVKKLKSKFPSEEIINEFHNSAKTVLQDKINLIKDKLAPTKQVEIEDLIKLIGVF